MSLTYRNQDVYVGDPSNLAAAPARWHGARVHVLDDRIEVVSTDPGKMGTVLSVLEPLPAGQPIIGDRHAQHAYQGTDEATGEQVGIAFFDDRVGGCGCGG